MDLPKEFQMRMREMIGDEYDEFIKSYDTDINKGVRINTLKCSDGLDIFSDNEQVLWCKDGYYTDNTITGNHPYHAAGVIYFQEPSAMIGAVAMPICEDA